MYNGLEMNINLTRREVIDLMIACTSAQYEANDGGKKWAKLHEKLKLQLDEFDAENVDKLEEV